MTQPRNADISHVWTQYATEYASADRLRRTGRKLSKARRGPSAAAGGRDGRAVSTSTKSKAAPRTPGTSAHCQPNEAFTAPATPNESAPLTPTAAA